MGCCENTIEFIALYMDANEPSSRASAHTSRGTDVLNCFLSPALAFGRNNHFHNTPAIILIRLSRLAHVSLTFVSQIIRITQSFRVPCAGPTNLKHPGIKLIYFLLSLDRSIFVERICV